MVKKISKNPLIEKTTRLIENSEKIIKSAKKNNKSLHGEGFYAKKYLTNQIDFTNLMTDLKNKFQNNEEVLRYVSEMSVKVSEIFNSETQNNTKKKLLKEINIIFNTKIKANLETSNYIPSNNLFPYELVKNTKIYVEKISMQALGCYDNDWHDAAAVMIRRLLETLIIECYEAKDSSSDIKDKNKNFLYLEGLINKLLEDDGKLWNLSRNTKKVLPKLKKIGDQSAHSRFYTARKPDIDNLKGDLRIAIEELIHISDIKKR